VRWTYLSIRLAVVVTAVWTGQGLGAAEPAPWRFPNLSFRCPVIVESGMYARENAEVRCNVDFTALLKAAGPASTAVDGDSVRLAADDEGGKEVPAQFFRAPDFDPAQKASGVVAWRIPDKMEPLSVRRYWLYFGVAGATKDGRKPSRVPSATHGNPDNAVRNPGFETPDPRRSSLPAEWEVLSQAGATGEIGLVTDPRRSDERALKITCRSGRLFGCRQTKIPMKPNALYRATVWVRGDPGNEVGAVQALLTVWLYRQDGRKVRTSNAKLQKGCALDPGNWTRLETRGLAYKGKDVPTPPDTAFGVMQIVLYPSSRQKGAEAVGALYVDDVEITEVTPESRIPPPVVRLGEVERMTTRRDP